MIALLVLLSVVLAVGIFYFGAINIQGHDDGLNERYANGYRGLGARVYNMGYESAAGRNTRFDKNLADNQKRSGLEK